MALDFNGTNSVVTSAANSALNNLAALSCAAWVYLDSAGEGGAGRYFYKAIAGSVNGWWLLSSDTWMTFSRGFDSLSFCSRTSNAFSSIIGRWAHLAATWAGGANQSNVKLYLDGIEQGYASGLNGTGSRIDDSSAPLRIGNVSDLSRTVDGRIADPCIWNTVLSADDIASAAKAVSHAKIRPQNIVDHRQFIRDGRPWKGGANTDSNVTAAAHPRIFY